MCVYAASRPRLTVLRSLRRVKCDETRPQCAKCTSSGRECEYGVRILSSTSERSSRALLPVSHRQSQSGRPITTHLGNLSPNTPETACISSFAHADDRRAYDYFLNVSLDEIASTSPAGSEWIFISLQHSKIKHIFHAIAAVGKAHASISRVSHFTLVRYVRAADHEAAMRHYGKAVSALQDYINDVVEKQAPIEPVLLACSLLTCYEILMDGKGMVSNHYRLGRRIVDQSLKAAQDRRDTSSPSLETTRHLAAAFNIFGRGGQYYWDEYDRAVGGQPSFQPRIPGSVSTAFTSFVEADVHLEHIVSFGEETRTEILKLAQDYVRRAHGESLEPVVSFCLANCLSRSIDMPAAIQRRLEETKLAHTHWLHALQVYMSQQSLMSSPISLLTQVRYFASWLVIATCRESREVLVDRFEPEFSRILDVTEQYFRHLPGQALPVRSPLLRGPIGLSLEGGLLPALHLIACKSRSSAIRRRAANILINADRQEGTTYSGVIGLIVGSAAELEEGRARALQSDSLPARYSFASDQIPEEARFADSVIKGSPGNPPLFKLACARYLHDQDGRIEVKEYSGEGLPLDLRFVRSRVFDCSQRLSIDGRVLLPA